MKPTFSIIIPVYNREKTIARCINSVLNQTYDKDLYEIIIVDDGSTDNTLSVARRCFRGENPFGVFHSFESNQGRLKARNKGMEIAKKEWICWLDSDDEYLSTYLETMAKAIEENPEFDLFNCGAIVYNEPSFSYWIRDTFLPETRGDGRGHVQFKSGGIGSGSFVFRKNLIADVGYLPEAQSPYGGNDSLPAMASVLWPELETLYGRTDGGQWKPFGNPWGDDWLMFYLLTRNHLSKPLDLPLYLQHLRK